MGLVVLGGRHNGRLGGCGGFVRLDFGRGFDCFRGSGERVGGRAWVRLVRLAVGEEAFEGPVVGAGVADLIAVEEVEDMLFGGVGDHGAEGERVGVACGFVAELDVLGVGDALLADDVGKACGFHAEGAGAAPHGADHGVDEVSLVLVEGLEFLVEVGAKVQVGLGAFGFHDADGGEESVAAGIVGGARFSFLGDGAFGFGTVGPGGGYLSGASGSLGFGCFGFWGMGQVFHRAVIVAGAGVENELRGLETTAVGVTVWLLVCLGWGKMRFVETFCDGPSRIRGFRLGG